MRLGQLSQLLLFGGIQGVHVQPVHYKPWDYPGHLIWTPCKDIQTLDQQQQYFHTLLGWKALPYLKMSVLIRQDMDLNQFLSTTIPIGILREL